jgi:serine/threonine-protein kinase HipA
LSIRTEGREGGRPATGCRDVSAKLESLLNTPMHKRPSLVNGLDARLSIAGFVDKVPLHIINGRYCLPEAGSDSATSVILKAQSPRFGFLCENEYFCMDLAGRIGLPVPVTRIVKIGDVFALLTERYDRRMEEGLVTRLHREDFCQALTFHRQEKYEMNSGPSFSTCADLLFNSGLERIGEARDNFVKAALFNIVIGNCDAHAKNFSILYSSHIGGKSLAPFYDILSTVIYPGLDRKFAMAAGGSFMIHRINSDEWIRFAADMRMEPNALAHLALDTFSRITEAVDDSIEEICTVNPDTYDFFSRLKTGMEAIMSRITNTVKPFLKHGDKPSGGPDEDGHGPGPGM